MPLDDGVLRRRSSLAIGCGGRPRGKGYATEASQALVWGAAREQAVGARAWDPGRDRRVRGIRTTLRFCPVLSRKMAAWSRGAAAARVPISASAAFRRPPQTA